MRTKGGGGGGRIVINPAHLRRGAKRLRGAGADLKGVAGRLRGAGVPAMPADLLGAITSGLEDVAATLTSIPEPLQTAGVELERRALWAEIADELAAGYPLSGPQLAEFVAGLKDGSLVKYAEPWQAELAGSWVASQFAGDYKKPERFLELAHILGANAQDTVAGKSFAGAFVRDFGAERMLELPRVLQALEWARPMNGGMIPEYLNPFIQWDVARDAGYEFQLKEDPLELLGALSMTLALATQSSVLTSTDVDDELARAEDKWALGALMHEGVFGKQFLLDTFKHGVIDEVVEEANLRRGFSPEEWPSEMFQLGGADGKGGISLDEKTLIMSALARNPEAAAAALTGPISVELQDITGYHTYEDPYSLLYRHADFDDDGAAFSRAFGGAVDWLVDESPERGGELTLRAADELINDRRDIGGLHGMGHMTDELARVVGDHWIDDLHTSAVLTDSALDFDPDHDGVIGTANENGIHVSHRQIVELLSTFAQDADANQHIAEGTARHQLEQIVANTREGAPAGNDWAREIGRFDALVQSAFEEAGLDDVDEANARQAAFGRVYDIATNLVPTAKAFDVASPFIKDAISELFAGPSAREASAGAFDFHEDVRRGLTSTIVTGYFEHHRLESPSELREFVRTIPASEAKGFEPTSFLRGDRLIPYGEMSYDQAKTFDYWLENSAVVDRVARDDLNDATLAFTERDQDQYGSE